MKMKSDASIKENSGSKNEVTRNKAALVMLSNFLLSTLLKGEANAPDDYDAYIKNYLTIRIPRQVGVELASYKTTREISLELFDKVLERFHELEENVGKLKTTPLFYLLLDAISQTITSYIDYVKIVSHEMDIENKDDTEGSHFINVEIKEGGDVWLYKTINGEVLNDSKPMRNGAIFDVESHSNSVDNYTHIAFSFLSGFIASEKIQLELNSSLQRNPNIVLQAKKAALILGGDYRYYLPAMNHLNAMRFRKPEFLQKYAIDYIHSNYKWDYQSSVRIVEEVLKKAAVAE